MTAANVTIIVTQRERFGMTEESLEDLYAHTTGPFEVIYVDGNSPKKVADYLREQAGKRGFTLIRRNRFLTPNQARNIATAAARTKYVVYVDNDVLYTPGWLDALVQCAEETGAAVVAPLTCQGLPAHQEIHQAGGDYVADPGSMDAFFAEPPSTGRPFVEIMHAHGAKVAEWRERLKRQETGCSEFHCMLVRRDIFDKVGPLDEQMLSTKEHIDFALAVRSAGEKVYFEPASVVTYVFPCRARPIEPADWPFFALRWSDSYGKRSLAHFIRKWHLDTGPDYVKEKRVIYSMRRMQGILIPLMRKTPLINRSPQLTNWSAKLLAPFERQVNRGYVAFRDWQAR
jgi:GT2 family glycosyltransferase